MPSARSRLAEPVENESISRLIASFVILRMEPFPNCFSMVDIARAMAFSLFDSESIGTTLSPPRFFAAI